MTSLNPCASSEVDSLLLEHGNRPMKAFLVVLQDTNCKSNQGIALPMAIIMDRRCGIERRFKEADGPRYFVGASPLMLALYERRLDVAKALFTAGADPNAKASTGRNSLMEAALKGILEAVDSLISYGADIHAVDKDSWTPLHFAAAWGHASVIELLERAGPNLEAVDNKGRTPLHFAASNGKVDTIKALLDLGANQAAVDNEGRTPLHYAAAERVVSVDAIEAFRCNVTAFEANLTAVDTNGQTPLQVYESRSLSSSDDSKARVLLTPTSA